MDNSTEKTNENLLRLSGTVEDIIFSNPSNGYSVCELAVGGELITVTGFLPDITEGDSISAFGGYVTHPEYGEQFKAEYYEKNLPSTESEIEKYLASGMLPSIGKSTAHAIVEKFGENALTVIENEPQRLLEIKGLSQKKIDIIHKKFLEQIGVREAVMFFQSHGVSASVAARVFRVFGSESVHVAQNSPYQLIDTVDGFSFETADKIAHGLNFDKNDPKRIRAGIKYTLKREASTSGHTYLPRFMLIRRAANMLECESAAVEDAISGLLMDGDIVLENMGEYDAIYAEEYYRAEMEVAKRLRELSSIYFEINQSETDELIAEAESESNIILADSQRLAIKKALENSALVITGGPGTGKTTIVNTIIRVMERLGKRVALAAPTGRAAKRMTEVCGIEAKTIHRLLEITAIGDSSFQQFTKNERNPLSADVIIIDEMSMVDTCLMCGLLKAVPVGARLIMVGDADQIPSVGIGNVLRDIIDSELLECIRLTEIFRQAQESMIVVNSHKINNGEYPTLNERDNDFFFVRRNDSQSLCDTITDLCVNRLPRAYGIDSLSQIQVLTPARKTDIGAANLNRLLQNSLNPPSVEKPEKETRGRVYRLGDKVMQNKNNYRLEWRKTDGEKGTGVFNGDSGFITDIDHRNQTVTVMFDDKEVKYDFLQLDDLELAYAITVHKSQGSEFDAVVMPIFETHRLLMTRNLLYTAVTRAKSLVVLVGREDILHLFVDNNNIQNRFSGLKNRLRID